MPQTPIQLIGYRELVFILHTKLSLYTQVYEKKKRDRVSTILGVFVHAGLKHLQAANASSSNTRYNLKYRTNIGLIIC
jgi:hypothetical protein